MAILSKKSTASKGITTVKTTKMTKKASTAIGIETPTIEHTFQNGTKVVGTYEQLETIAKALGLKLVGVKGPVPRGFYPSESKGMVKISEMNDYHIRRALLKRSKDYYTEIYDKDDTNTTFLNKFTNLTNDNIIVDLFSELASRK